MGWKNFAYVNKEAISAGAYIAIATQEIAFAPFSQIGAAEAVSGGREIDPSMKKFLPKGKDSKFCRTLQISCKSYVLYDGCQCKFDHRGLRAAMALLLRIRVNSYPYRRRGG